MTTNEISTIFMPVKSQKLSVNKDEIKIYVPV